MSSDPKLIPYLLPMIDGVRILDAACGKGKLGYLTKVDFWYTADGRRKRKLDYLVGTDIFLPYLRFVKHHRVYDDIVCCDVSRSPFRSRAFDTTLAIEVLEHLTKARGVRLLEEAERVSRQSVIVTTPYHPTGTFAQDIKDGNIYQKHVSRWGPDELKKRGYRVPGRPLPMEKWLNMAQYLLPRLTGILPQLPISLLAKKSIRTKIPKSDSPEVSVIVTAKDENRNVMDCLSSLLNLDYANYEIIFVDGGSTDGTLDMVKDFAERYPNRMKLFSDRGACAASGRNRGISEALGEIVAFIDADCVAERSWLKRIVEPYISDRYHSTRLGGVGGANIPGHSNDTCVLRAIDSVASTFLGSGGSPQTYVYGRPRYVRSVPSCNSAYSAKMLKQVGGFNEELRYCEDSELNLRISRLGYKILFIPDAVVHHRTKYSSLASFARFIYKYGRGRAAAVRKDPRLLSLTSVLTIGYLLTTMALFLLSIFQSAEVFQILLFTILLYPSAIMASSIFLCMKKPSVKLLALAPLIYFVEHVAYASGLVVGFLRSEDRSQQRHNGNHR